MLLQLLPFALAGAFVPTWTSHVIILLATDRPVANGLAFVLGNFTFRMLLGLAVLYLMDATKFDRLTDSGAPNSTLMIVAAVTLWMLAFLLWRKGSRDNEELPGWMRAVERVPPALCFAYGMLLVALPGVQYVYFLGGVSVLGTASLSPPITVGLLALFSAFLQLMLLVPLGAFVFFRRQSTQGLARMKDWLAHHGNQVTAGLLLLFGVYALVIGVG